MYRDGATALDERDRAIDAILIGEELLACCERAAKQVQDPLAQARWRAAADIHDNYPEIWRHLDRARRVLGNRGINTAGYDELRPHVRKHVATDLENDAKPIDGAAFEDVKRALEELKLAVPGADWAAIEQRTNGLVGTQLERHRKQHRRQRLVIAGVVATLGIAVATWGFAISPVHKPNRTEVMHRELRDIQQHRRERIDELRAVLERPVAPSPSASLAQVAMPGPALRCAADAARELVKLLAMDGRPDEAVAFGDTYVARCGDDDVVEHWAHAPRP